MKLGTLRGAAGRLRRQFTVTAVLLPLLGSGAPAAAQSPPAEWIR